MAIPNTGAIDFAALGTEFGDTQPHSLNEFYRLLGPEGSRKVTNNNTNVPTSGAVSFNDFYGTSRQATLLTSNFTSTGNFTVPSGITAVEAIVVGGGGTGGTNVGGGGGGGGVAYNATLSVQPGATYQASVAGAGGQSNFHTMTANRGNNGGNTVAGGGSGGTPGPGGTGGPGRPPGSQGGAGQPGPTYALGQYGGGGGAGGYNMGGGPAGAGGGGFGSPAGGAQAGTPGTGGGGGGGYSNWQGGAGGGSGRVSVRYSVFN